MKASLLSFNTGLTDLRNYIEELELESDLLTSEVNEVAPMEYEYLLLKLQERALDISIKRRRFNYNSIIVSLYGYFEEYIESMLRAYVLHLNAIVPKYGDLPDHITKHQIDLSFRLMNRIERSRYRGMVTPEQLISNLHSCVTNDSAYKINAEAFTHHMTNFRIDSIQESFARIGIKGLSQKVKMCSIFFEYLQSIHPGRDVANLRLPEAFFFLNDLAERRNEVAHGMLPDDILSNKLLLDYINFFEVYGHALYDVVCSEALEYEIKYKGFKLGSPIAVLHKGKVVCITVKDTVVKVGDLLVAKTTDSNYPYLSGEIQELQVDNRSYPIVEPEVNVGILVPFKAKLNYSFFLLPK